MAVKLKSCDVTRYCFEFRVNDKDVVINLTKEYSWVLSVIKGNDLSIEELIEICNLIYSEGPIEETTVIIVTFTDCEPTYIRGKANITKEILNAVRVTLSEKDKN